MTNAEDLAARVAATERHLAARVAAIERYLAQANHIARSRGDSMPPLPAGWEAADV